MLSNNMLIIVSGPDRVGKTSLIKRIEMEIGIGDIFSTHHSEPSKNDRNITDRYKRAVDAWINSGMQFAIFDRAWPCSYILEQHRRRNLGHLEEIIDLELWMNNYVPDKIVHLAQFRPWYWCAKHHITEIRNKEREAEKWYIRDEYMARMQEHRVYTEQLIEFYENITMFPNVQLTETVSGAAALQLCTQATRFASS